MSEVIELGPHRLLCGDSLSPSDVGKLIGKKKASFVFNDPPFGEPMIGLERSVAMCSSNANIFTMWDDKCLVDYLRRSSFEFREFFITNILFKIPRGNLPFSQHISIAHEVNGNAFPFRNLKDSFGTLNKVRYRGNLKDDKTEHPHQKDAAYMKKLLIHYTRPGDIVIDLFSGSGTTLMACHATKRIFMGMEINPEWVELIRERWESRRCL